MKQGFSILATLTLTVIAYGDGLREIGVSKLPEFLQQFDTNEDGRIDEEERQAIRDHRRKLREERRNSIDTDDDGRISPEEIAAAREAIRERIAERRAAHFRELAGADGLLSPEEYANIPGIQKLPENLIDQIFDRLDADNSGDISLEEFNARLRSHKRGVGVRQRFVEIVSEKDSSTSQK